MSDEGDRIWVREERRSDDEIVNDWRFERFVVLGFNAAEAQALADSSADLHLADRLVARGCSLELVLRIVRD